MLTLDFPGARRLVDALDRAICRDCPTEITDQLRHTLCKLIRDPEVRLPDCVFEPVGDHYARRELYVSEEHGYCVIAMTWGPGQGTPIHDHAGMWCVEGVWHGSLEITPYELTGRDSERYRFESRGTMIAGAGSAGSLIPPHEYHTIQNPSDDDVAVSLHIYRGPMTCCSVFKPLADCWYERDERKLSLDLTH
ncbi:cysteine dioxygenase family protein [Tahibacter amnicola]|uniref:Cysteine dioxygenase family protein n=1 Tax=Tahibacter amnicola TaxID=2976241 RepID=A0ABY6BAH9_9GAMM|nr:cysteine dioxygenase family protein [Tahibacter amnicola]UXI67073.1 cysteine dioxygenase family protein [Tahibacter amnicola]